MKIFYILIIAIMLFFQSCKAIPICENKVRIPVIDKASEYISIKDQIPSIIIWSHIAKPSSKGFYPNIINALWDDGTVIWSNNKLYGGPPYFIDALQKDDYETLTNYLESKAVLEPLEIYKNNFGPDADYVAIFLSFNGSYLSIRSWHELIEQNTDLVAASYGVTFLDGNTKEKFLYSDKKDYQDFRFLWSEIRTKIAGVIPQSGRPIDVTFILNELCAN